ncbi:alpha/beta hydrolase fold domain-containing protein [Stieleria varia]|uniref:Acetylxylan esterase n=1 Tax=Stieleria varia TaxID=2528005 RepID=A0A5C6AQB1_9BACT|nr:alpha/beta hydrolase fold domain-containing protein [Stieleria varia]TWU01172.1 Acetylxylan esterase precursor [Stieleria varia]
MTFRSAFLCCIFAASLAVFATTATSQDAQTEKRMRDAGAEIEVYKTTEDADGKAVSLEAYVFYPPNHNPGDRRSAIVFFFGGGWKSGTPAQFSEHCRYLAARGMVAITADYRVLSRQGTKAVSCVADGKSAIRWVRQNAERLGVDTNRVAAGGGSAGGHVAACTGVIAEFDESGENNDVSSRPNAMALFNPAVVLASIDERLPLDRAKLDELAERMGTSPESLSPVHHVGKDAPPTILFHGRADDTVPYWTAEAFRDAMVAAGNRCELVGFDGEGHGFFNHGRGNNSSYERTIRELDSFLVSLGYITARKPADSLPIATIDLDSDTKRQVIVDREEGQYLGHPTTCLLEDGKTILCVYPKGHGRGGIVFKRSDDGGVTWSDRLPTPENWMTSKEVPTLHRVVDPQGTKRIIMWSGLYPARLAVSEDNGETWGPLQQVGDWGGIVVMGFVEPLKTGPGHYLAMFHDDGRFFTKKGKATGVFTLYQTFSKDGGLTWSDPESIFQSSEVHLCEPGCIRSPDGKRLAVLLRENSRRKNSHVIFSDDEAVSWSQPRELPLTLTGDRHTGKYTEDGRLFVSFRCVSPKQSSKQRLFEGDWVGWVGAWGDLVNGDDGQYFVRLKDNQKGYDTAYPGVEVLPDDTIVTTTYGHWDQDKQPYILSVRLKLPELDAMTTQ